MGKRKTTRHQRTLCSGGRLDWIISTALLLAKLLRCERAGYDAPHAIMSSTRTMNPTIPPPVGPCQFADWVVMGAASTARAMESWRRAASTSWNMVMLVDGKEVIWIGIAG
jgi:hypothetical protein